MPNSRPSDAILRELNHVRDDIKSLDAKVSSVIHTVNNSFHPRLSRVEQVQVERLPHHDNHSKWIGELKEVVTTHKTLFKLIGAAVVIISGALIQHIAFH